MSLLRPIIGDNNSRIFSIILFFLFFFFNNELESSFKINIVYFNNELLAALKGVDTNKERVNTASIIEK